jgi:hypothetical protein
MFVVSCATVLHPCLQHLHCTRETSKKSMEIMLHYVDFIALIPRIVNNLLPQSPNRLVK